MFAQHDIVWKEALRAGGAGDPLAILPGSQFRPGERIAPNRAAARPVERCLVVAPLWGGQVGFLIACTAALSFCSGLCVLAVSSAIEMAVPRWAILAYGAACAMQALLAPALGRPWRLFPTSCHPDGGFPRIEGAPAFRARSSAARQFFLSPSPWACPGKSLGARQP
jgi:hypothetical protein